MTNYQYEIIDGQYVEKNVALQFKYMRNAFWQRFRLTLRISSGTRIGNMQEVIFRQRYVLSGDVRGRRVYDTRWWNGRLWYRISSAGTVAVPGTSNHEENGPNGPRSIDIADDGADAGVTRRGSERDRWMQDNAHRWGFENEGYNFGEAWHKTFRWAIGQYAAPTPAPAPAAKPEPLEENDMIGLSINAGDRGTHLAIIGPGSFRHLIQADEPEKVKNIVKADDRWDYISIAELPIYLRTFGCDLNIWDFRGEKGRFCVLDPITGGVEPGNVWTATGAARAQSAKESEAILKALAELTKAVKALAPVKAKSVEGPTASA